MDEAIVCSDDDSSDSADIVFVSETKSTDDNKDDVVFICQENPKAQSDPIAIDSDSDKDEELPDGFFKTTKCDSASADQSVTPDSVSKATAPVSRLSENISFNLRGDDQGDTCADGSRVSASLQTHTAPADSACAAKQNKDENLEKFMTDLIGYRFEAVSSLVDFVMPVPVTTSSAPSTHCGRSLTSHSIGKTANDDAELTLPGGTDLCISPTTSQRAPSEHEKCHVSMLSSACSPIPSTSQTSALPLSHSSSHNASSSWLNHSQTSSASSTVSVNGTEIDGACSAGVKRSFSLIDGTSSKHGKQNPHHNVPLKKRFSQGSIAAVSSQQTTTMVDLPDIPQKSKDLTSTTRSVGPGGDSKNGQVDVALPDIPQCAGDSSAKSKPVNNANVPPTSDNSDIKLELPDVPLYVQKNLSLPSTSKQSVVVPSSDKRVSQQSDVHRCLQCYTPGLHENMSWCMMGHPSCGSCLQDQVKQLLAKSEKGSLQCVAADCSSYYLLSQLQRTLPSMVVEILEDKLEQEYLNDATNALMQTAMGQLPDIQLSRRARERNARAAMETDDSAAPAELPDLLTADAEDSNSCSKPPQMKFGVASLEFPDYWENMDDHANNGYVLVDVKGGSEEFSSISLHFYESMPFPQAEIMSIQRIQNTTLWMFFSVKKQQMRLGNGGEQVVEKQLFHGTKSSLVDAIAKNNFDWRVCGVNGTAYGQGSYFARDANYSHRYTDVARSTKKGRKKVPASAAWLSQQLRRVQSTGATNLNNLPPLPPGILPLSNHTAVTQGPPGPVGHSAAGVTGSWSKWVVTQSGSRSIQNTGNNYQQQPSSVAASGAAVKSAGNNQAAGWIANMSPSIPHSQIKVTFTNPFARINQSSMPSQLVQGSSNNGRGFVVYQQSHSNNNNMGTIADIDTEDNPEHLHTMIVSKVLVGQYTQGSNKLRKPPPLDESDPYGKAYDSCVDNIFDPAIFVIFDSAQCYPEYVIKYKFHNW